MWSRLWQRYRSDIERHNGPLLWLAVLVFLPLIVAVAVSYLGARIFATILSLLVRLITIVTAPRRNAAIDRICNAAFGPVVGILMLGFWAQALYRLGVEGRLAALTPWMQPYLVILALTTAAVIAYAVIVRRCGRLRFLQPVLAALVVIAGAAWLWGN